MPTTVLASFLALLTSHGSFDLFQKPEERTAGPEGIEAVRDADQLRDARADLLRCRITVLEMREFATVLDELEAWARSDRAAWGEAVSARNPLQELRKLRFWREQSADPNAYVATREKLDMAADVAAGTMQVESLEKQAATLRRLLEEADMSDHGRAKLRANIHFVESLANGMRDYPEVNRVFFEQNKEKILGLLARVNALEDLEVRPPMILDGAARGFRLYGSGNWQAQDREAGTLAVLQLTAPLCRLECRSLRFQGEGAWNEEVVLEIFGRAVKHEEEIEVLDVDVAETGPRAGFCGYRVATASEETRTEDVRGLMHVIVVGQRFVVFKFETDWSRWSEVRAHVNELIQHLEILAPQGTGGTAATPTANGFPR